MSNMPRTTNKRDSTFKKHFSEMTSVQMESPKLYYHIVIHSKKKSTSEHLFLVLQVVTNRRLYSVPGRTK